MSEPSVKVVALLAEFDSPERLLEAAHAARKKGFRDLDAYAPFPVEALPEAIGFHRDAVALLTLLGGIAGGTGGYFMQWYANVIDYPLNIGSRPLNSWPAFVPVTFELTVLAASLTAAFAMLALNRLPRLHHPVFEAPAFQRASRDRFFLSVGAKDPRFRLDEARSFLATLAPLSIEEVRDES